MAAAQMDIVIEQGSQFKLTVEYEKDGDPVDLIGDTYTARLQVRKSYSSEVALVSLTDGAGLTLSLGKIEVEIDALDTALLPQVQGVWDLKVMPAGVEDEAKRLLEGKAIINPAATRP